MSTSRKIDRICMGIIAALLAITILFMNGSKLGIVAASASLGYETRLFDTGSVHRVDIVMDDWDSFIENCESEEYSACTVVIDGEKYKNVALRAKGNTSLSSVRSMGSQRYSFKIEFDHYESGKTYYGLDKLCLNNLIQDNTMMKDYLTYQMMKDFGVDTPLCSFVYITVNGEDWGLYLAVEGIEDSFLTRNYGSNAGEMYKPDSMSFGGGRGNGRDFNMDDFTKSQEEESGSSSTSEGILEKLFGKSGGSSETESSESSSGDTDADSGGGSGSSSERMPSGESKMPARGSAENAENAENADNEQAGAGEQAGPGAAVMGSAENADNEQAGAGEQAGPGAAVMGSAESADNEQAGAGEKADAGAAATESMENGQAGTGEQADAGAAGETAAAAEGSTNSADRSGRPGGFGGPGGAGGPGGSGMGSDDVKLKYIDDDPDSYSNIFDSAKTDITKADKARLIASLKKLSEYTDLENTLDMEEVLRYFVVHNFVVNGDSYTGSMIHNYYLHEKDGRLGMIPWDYNLAYGTFQGGDASSSVNSSIDEPVSGGDVNDRPMVGWIFSDESYTQRYHELFSEFIEKWFSNGELASMIEQTADLIRSYVEKDPTKFCTAEEFETGVETLSKFVTLRAEAVSRQLEGDSTEVEVKDLTLSDMGTMGGGFGKGAGGFGDFDLSSMIKVTDADGKEVSLADLVGDVSNLASFELSDGTTVDVKDAEIPSLMKSLTQVDLSTVVSATDQDGKVTDLSGYTLSLNMPSRGGERGGGGGSFGGPSGGRSSGDNSEGTAPADSSSAGGDSQKAASSETGSNGESETSGQGSTGTPGMPGGDSGFPGPGESPFGQDQTTASGQTTWILIGSSVLVLAAGILIAVKKK